MKVNLGTLQVAADAFEHGSPMPERYSIDGEGHSPALSWSGAPEGTGSFALVVHDPDAPLVDGFVHWVVYGIPASTTSLSQGARGAFVDGVNTLGEPGWRPAAPPPGHGTHHYFFHLFAISDEMSDLPAGLSRHELMARIDPHVLNQARLVGTYRREASA